jgi:hypothetical protein
VVSTVAIATALFLGLFVYFLAITLRMKATGNREDGHCEECITSAYFV